MLWTFHIVKVKIIYKALRKHGPHLAHHVPRIGGGKNVRYWVCLLAFIDCKKISSCVNCLLSSWKYENKWDRKTLLFIIILSHFVHWHNTHYLQIRFGTDTLGPEYFCSFIYIRKAT